jgi:predicted AAA+ superfamily ATPase
MHGCIDRFVEKELNRSLARSPAVAILGPRQCGKSTTAKLLLKSIPSVYLDLQDRVDRNKLAEPELFLITIVTNSSVLMKFNFCLNFFQYFVRK